VIATAIDVTSSGQLRRAAQRPEQIGFRCRRRRADRAVRAHDTRRQQAVDRQPVLAPHPSFAAAERESSHPGFRHHAAGHDLPERLCLAIEIAPQSTALPPRNARVWIEFDPAHPGEIDHEPVVAARVTGHGVAAAANRREQVVLTCEPDGVDDVGRPGAPGNERRAPLMHGVVNGFLSVPGVARFQHSSADRCREVIDHRVLEFRSFTIDCCDRNRHGILL